VSGLDMIHFHQRKIPAYEISLSILFNSRSKR